MLTEAASTKKPSNSCRTDELEILKEAAKALAMQDLLRKLTQQNEEHLRKLCREYDTAARVWGFRPYHLRRACETRGLL